MFTHKDIQYRSIFVVNCIKNRNLRVSSGELLLEDSDEKKTLTKFPFQKILALFIIGPISITTPLIEKCKKFNVALVVMKANLRPVFFYSATAEANFLLREKQYLLDKREISIAKFIVWNKVKNQLQVLQNMRKKNEVILKAKEVCANALTCIESIDDYNFLMGTEGTVAKSFFSAFFQDFNWIGRYPRTKIDPINATLDVGYTILFNFVEVFIRMFGFDPYIGVYHRLWFKRKSLVCDLMEPFRVLIDVQVRKSLNLGQIKAEDFQIIKNEYVLKFAKYPDYAAIFYQALVERKMDFFKYVQSYYRAFMSDGQKKFQAFDV